MTGLRMATMARADVDIAIEWAAAEGGNLVRRAFAFLDLHGGPPFAGRAECADAMPDALASRAPDPPLTRIFGVTTFELRYVATRPRSGAGAAASGTQSRRRAIRDRDTARAAARR